MHLDTIRILPGNRQVTIKINGRDFVELITKIERPFARASGDVKLAGNYKNLPPKVIFSPSRHLLGKPSPGYDHDNGRDAGKVCVLECGDCGYTQCSCLLVRILVEDAAVTWSEFEQPDIPEWDYGKLRFVFARTQYIAELARRPRTESDQ